VVDGLVGVRDRVHGHAHALGVGRGLLELRGAGDEQVTNGRPRPRTLAPGAPCCVRAINRKKRGKQLVIPIPTDSIEQDERRVPAPGCRMGRRNPSLCAQCAEGELRDERPGRRIFWWTMGRDSG